MVLDINFSHCFGEISSGFNLSSLSDDDKLDDYMDYTSSKYIHNVNFGEDIISNTLPKQIKVNNLPVNVSNIDVEQPNLEFTKSPNHVEHDINKNGSNGIYSYKNYIKLEDNIFVGDIVEFNDKVFSEIILEPIYHRFNTTQRESDERIDRILRFHEIRKDDSDSGTSVLINYDPLSPTPTYTTSVSDDDNTCDGNHFIFRGELNVNPRPEGYLYKPHNKIQIKRYSQNIIEKSFKVIPFERFGVDVDNNIYIICKQKHNKLSGDVIRVSFKNIDVIYKVKTSSMDNYKLIIPFDEIFFNHNIKDIVIRDYDNLTPEYAINIGDGRFVWRRLLNDGEIENIKDIVIENVFTNGCYYLNENLDFFLHRQDSFGKNGLLYKSFPNDIYGTQLDTSEYNINKINELC